MKTTTTPSIENEAISLESFFIELLLKRLNEKRQNAIELTPKGGTDLYSTAYFKGCQAAYQDAIEDIQTYLIEARRTVKENQSINP